MLKFFRKIGRNNSGKQEKIAHLVDVLYFTLLIDEVQLARSYLVYLVFNKTLLIHNILKYTEYHHIIKGSTVCLNTLF